MSGEVISRLPSFKDAHHARLAHHFGELVLDATLFRPACGNHGECRGAERSEVFWVVRDSSRKDQHPLIMA